MLGMFFAPSVLLGIPTPLLTTLALRLDERAGRIVGRMHALAAPGSIIGTFLTGYVLIQYFGSPQYRHCLRCVAFCSRDAVLQENTKSAACGACCFGLGLSVIVYALRALPTRVIEKAITLHWRVVDASAEAPFRIGPRVNLDHLLHSMNHQEDPAMLMSPYVQLMDELVLAHFEASAIPTLKYFSPVVAPTRSLERYRR